MKICSKCKESKKLSEFAKRSDSKDGYRSQCKNCVGLNPNIKKTSKNYYLKNREKLLKKANDRKRRNLDHGSKRRTIKRMMELCESYQSLCTKCMKIQDKENFVKDNSRKNRTSAQCNDCKNAYYKYKKKSDIIFKLSTNIRSMISTYIKSNGIKKTRRSEEIIGCSFIELKSHIELKFIEGMSWENYGLWHIDHIIPISYAKSEVEIYKLNHYSNFQPLWAKDNLSKGNRFIG
jgi:hypothetical protein